MRRAIIRAKIVSHTIFRADRSLFRTDLASSSNRILSQSQKFLELLSFFFYFCTLLLFGFSLYFFPPSFSSLFLNWDCFGSPSFRRRTLDGDAVCALASSRTPLHSNSASIRIVTLKSHYLHIDMYTYILASMRIPVRSVRKFNDNLLFCILEYRRENELTNSLLLINIHMVAPFFYAACVRDGISEVQQSDVRACERSIYFQGVRVSVYLFVSF